MYGKGALMISEFIRKADLCKKSIDALRPLEGQMLKLSLIHIWFFKMLCP